MSSTQLEYRVKTFRDNGLEARWTRTRRGRPCIVVRDKKYAKKWLLVDKEIFAAMQADGVHDAYVSRAVMLDLFSIPAE